MTARFLKEASCCKADTSFCTAPLFQLGWNSSAHILDYLCNMNGLQLRSQDTSKDKDTKKSQEDWEERAMICKTTAPEIDSQPLGLPNCTDISEVWTAVCYSVSAALILSRSELFLKINFTLSSNSNSFYFKGFAAEANYLVVKPQTKWVRTPQVGWSMMEKSIFLVLYSIVYIIGFFLSVEPSHHMMNINKLNVKSLQNNL